MFKVAIVGALANNYITRCISSWLSQKGVDFRIQVIIDPVPGDGTAEKASRYYGIDPRLSIRINTTRQYAIPNFLTAFKLLNPVDDDILVMADADDWAATDSSLSIVKSYYDRQPNLLLTHGTWVSHPDPALKGNNYPYTEQDFRTGLRRVGWRASHLRTFKYKLWKHLKDEDLRDARGEYYRVTWDIACIWPLLEMAGFHRIKYIPEILYVYNQETPFNDSKLYAQEQASVAAYLGTRPPYPYIENL